MLFNVFLSFYKTPWTYLLVWTLFFTLVFSSCKVWLDWPLGILVKSSSGMLVWLYRSVVVNLPCSRLSEGRGVAKIRRTWFEKRGYSPSPTPRARLSHWLSQSLPIISWSLNNSESPESPLLTGNLSIWYVIMLCKMMWLVNQTRLTNDGLFLFVLFVCRCSCFFVCFFFFDDNFLF